MCTCACTGGHVAGSAGRVGRRRARCGSGSRQHPCVTSPGRTGGVCPVPSCVAQPHGLTQGERERAAGPALGRAGTSAPGGGASSRERAARTRSRRAGLDLQQHPPPAVLAFGFGCSLGHLRVVPARSAEPEAADCGGCASPGPARHGEKNGSASPAPAAAQLCTRSRAHSSAGADKSSLALKASCN